MSSSKSGHRRVNACKQLGLTEIPAEIREYSDLLVIESNRYRKKTLTELEKEDTALQQLLKPKAKEKQQVHGNTAPGITLNQNLDEVLYKEPQVSRQAAKITGTSDETLRKFRVVQKEKPELVPTIDSGKKSVDGAYRQVKREKNLQEFHAKEQPLPSGENARRGIVE